MRAALNLPDDDDDGETDAAEGGKKGGKKAARRPFQWGALRDALSCLLAEAPEQRPAGLDGGVWALIQKRVSGQRRAGACVLILAPLLHRMRGVRVRSSPPSLPSTNQRTQATAWETAVYAPSERHNCAVAAARCRDLVRWSVGPLLWRVLADFEAAAAEAAADGGGAAAASGRRVLAASGGGARQLQQQGEQQQKKKKQQRKPSRRPPARLALYSAHDSTLHSVLAALGRRTRAWAPFTATVAFELWRAPAGAAGSDSGGGGGGGGGRDWVRILFNGRPLELDGGDGDGDAAEGAGAAEAGTEAAEAGAKAPDGREQQLQQWRRAARADLERRRQARLRAGRRERFGGGGAAADDDADGDDQGGQQQQQQEQEEPRQGGMPGSSGGGESPGGWVRLADLKQRLAPFAASDEEKERECWPPEERRR